MDEEAEVEEIQDQHDFDPDDDDRLWFKHPKAVRRALRQRALWKASQLKTPPKNDFAFRTSKHVYMKIFAWNVRG